MISEEENNYLKLSSDPVRFEPVSKVTNVFFDETNKEIISVRGGGTLGVVAKGNDLTHTFCLENKSTISSIKFSPDHKVLAVHRTATSVELFTYKDGELLGGCVQETRTKGCNLLGFVWTSADDLVLISTHSIELYQVYKERLALKFVKSHSQNTKWFLWSTECKVVLLCTQTSPSTSTLQPISFSTGQMLKLNKFEVESNVALTERDINLGIMYGSTSICIIGHFPSNLGKNQTNLDFITQSKDGSFKKTHTSQLELTGKFALSFLDNLIVVHHRSSKTSLLLDICLPGKVTGNVSTIWPVALSQSVRNCTLKEASVPTSDALPSPVVCPLYAPTWVMFYPNIIIDVRLGCMWRLELVLEDLADIMDDKALLIDCLLRRKHAKPLVLKVVKNIIEKRSITQLNTIFDNINSSYHHHLKIVVQMGDSVNESSSLQIDSHPETVVIDQADMYSKILAPLMEQADKHLELSQASSILLRKGGVDTELIVNVIVNYVRSLDAAGISVQYFLYELLINGMVRTKQFYQLHQLLQYHVLADSKPLACLLLSLVGVYAAGEQLSLDMLSRLNTAHDEIIEVLLSHKMVTEALKYAKSVGYGETISARKFLEAAMTLDDECVFYSTFKFFASRNITLRGSSNFAKGEYCDVYVEHFRKLFHCEPEFYLHDV